MRVNVERLEYEQKGKKVNRRVEEKSSVETQLNDDSQQTLHNSSSSK